ncbi:MAG: uracil-DNA glycosylase, partial [Akkermansia sp.]
SSPSSPSPRPEPEPVKTPPPGTAPELFPEERKPSSSITLPEGTMEDKLQYLRDLAQNWKPARDLNSLRDTMVFATGNPHTQLMLIGEAPGYYEEVQREPFVGRAGEKLNQILKAMGLSRDMVYISNIVKFRPALPNQRTNNRAPTPEEIEACLPIIMHEIQVIQPKMIIALGGTAAVGLLGEQGSVSSMRGRFHDLNGIPVRVTYHPSYLLRSDNPREKRKVWEDMLAVMERMGMPVSEKQRGYFLPRE